jgi:hypothetical protein
VKLGGTFGVEPIERWVARSRAGRDIDPNGHDDTPARLPRKDKRPVVLGALADEGRARLSRLIGVRRTGDRESRARAYQNDEAPGGGGRIRGLREALALELIAVLECLLLKETRVIIPDPRADETWL